MNNRFLIQVAIGALIVAAGGAYLVAAICQKGFYGNAILEALFSALVIGIGMLVITDAAILFRPEGQSNDPLP